ncbi:MAG: transketolase [Chloroflexota bacterium]
MSAQIDAVRDLEAKARVIRGHIVRMSHQSNSAHVGSALSSADIVTALYFGELRLDPNRPDWPDRDRFIMSKGHACAAWYAALAESGFFPLEELVTFRKIGSRLQGHPEMSRLPGIEMTSGSLGHGLSAGLGMALGVKLDKRDARVYVLMGDGEIQEGLIWEAALAAPNMHADNLTAIVDYNHWQSGGGVDETMSLEPLVDKWRAFGWATVEVDGHDMVALLETFAKAKRTVGKPTAVIAHTTKGKGVSYMENDNRWHGQPPTADEVKRALAELGLEGGER